MVCLLFLYYSIWLNPEAGNMKRIQCSDWLPGRARWARLSPAFLPPFSLSLFLAKFVRSRFLDIGLFLSFSLSFFFCVFYWRPEFVSIHRDAKKTLTNIQPSLTLRFALAFSYPKSWIHDFGLPRYLLHDLSKSSCKKQWRQKTNKRKKNQKNYDLTRHFIRLDVRLSSDCFLIGLAFFLSDEAVPLEQSNA